MRGMPLWGLRVQDATTDSPVWVVLNMLHPVLNLHLVWAEGCVVRDRRGLDVSRLFPQWGACLVW